MLQFAVSCDEDFSAGVRYASACRFLRRRLLSRCPICFSLPFRATKTSQAGVRYSLACRRPPEKSSWQETTS